MKKIGIDARLYFQTGVGVYIRNFLHFLQESDTEAFEFYIYVMKHDADKISFKNHNFKKIEVSYKWHSVAEQVGFLSQLNKDNLDLMHFTYFSHPVLYNRPFISTVHDVILLEHRTGKASTLLPFIYKLKHLAFTYAFFHQINSSRAVITPTKTVKDQILKIYGQKFDKKIVPIYEGIDYAKLEIKENLDLKQKFNKKFFLYVGNFYPHKNVERLVNAFSKIKEDVNLVLVGPSDYFSEKISELIKQLKQENRIILYANAADADLIYFYKNAEALIHPSLSEGFGLPLIEAACFNLPVIASNIPVFKELLEDDYLSFDGNSTEDIQSKIMSFITTPHNYKNKLSSKFSFEEMSKKTLYIYKEVLNTNS